LLLFRVVLIQYPLTYFYQVSCNWSPHVIKFIYPCLIFVIHISVTWNY
jgi:hypothetical protein